MQVWISTCERRWIRELLSPHQWKSVLSCQRVLAVVKLGMKSRSVDCAIQSGAIAERLDISRRCAGNVRSQLASQVPRAAVTRAVVKVTRRRNTDKCYCCGQLGHRRPDCSRRNENCSRCGKRRHLSQVCRSDLGANANARAVEAEFDELEEECKETHVWAMSVCNNSDTPSKVNV